MSTEDLAVICEILVSRVESQGDPVRQRRIDITAQRPSGEAVGTRGDAAFGRLESRCLGNPVDHPAATAAPEQQGICALENLDALGVVERAIVLRVVADTIKVEVGSGALTANHDLIAVAFALAERDARNIPQRVIELLDTLIVKLVAVERRHALRGIEQRGAGLDRARLVAAVAVLAVAIDDDPGRLPLVSRSVGHGRLRKCQRDQGGGGEQTGHGG